jgi:hypothetical protein
LLIFEFKLDILYSTLSQKDLRIDKLDEDYQKSNKENLKLSKSLKDITLKHTINDLKSKKMTQELEEITKRFVKTDTT